MGRTKKLIDEFIEKRAKGDNFLVISTKFKLLLKGINADEITDDTPDDPEIIEKIIKLAEILEISLKN